MAAQLTATKGPVPARRQLVNGAGHQLLAGTALAGDQHGGVGGGRHLGEPVDLLHRLAGAEQAAEATGLLELAAQQR